MTPAVYLDYNATAPLKPAVAEAMADVLARTGNPSSVHGFGREARRALERARAQVAALVGARPERVVFTSGGTEANNLVLRGAGRRRRLISAVEHVSVRDAAQALDGDCVELAVDGDGIVEPEELARALEAGGTGTLVSVMAANNETGVIQPIARLARLARDAGALFHCDAIQAAGKIPLDLAALGVDYLTLSAHKIGGPQGAGALVLGEGAEVGPMQVGGGQELGRRAGTENVGGAVGFGVAADEAAGDLARAPEIARLRDSLEARLRAVAGELTVFGAGAARLANTSCLVMPGVASATQVMAFDLDGVALSAGAACSSGKVGASHVLRAMGVADAIAACAIRVSLGPDTGAGEIERFVELWRRLFARLGARRSAA